MPHGVANLFTLRERRTGVALEMGGCARSGQSELVEWYNVHFGVLRVLWPPWVCSVVVLRHWFWCFCDVGGREGIGGEVYS